MKKVLTLFAMVLLLFSISFGSTASSSTPDRVFLDDFSGKLSTNWRVTEGDWMVENNKLVGKGVILSRVDLPTNRVVKFHLKTLEEESVSFLGKYESDENLVRISLNSNGTTQFIVLDEGKKVVDEQFSVPIELSNVHTYRVVFSGAEVRFSTDGETNFEQSFDPITEINGKFGLNTNSQVQVTMVRGTSFETPILITSIGQSPGAKMGQILADRANVSSIYKSRITPQELEETEAKTLIPIIGVSGKGLGAAGLDLSDEIDLASKVFDKAGALSIPIISMHIEGKARRGEMSDPIIKEFVPRSDYVVVKASGNQDDLFTDLANTNDIPFLTIEGTAGVSAVLSDLFYSRQEQ